jgi:hypothetical protein
MRCGATDARRPDQPADELDLNPVGRVFRQGWKGTSEVVETIRKV